MAASADAIITAGLRPELFADQGILASSRTLIITALTVLVLLGFGFRATGLSTEGLGEDELNKLEAVQDYRQHGLTSANGEHPLLMKALQTASGFLAEKWNNSTSHSSWTVAPETALRLPSAIFGALTSILIYFLATELFGAEVGLIAAALWAVDPNAIGFNRIAKEDTFLVFFFLLASIFWLRGQRAAESKSVKDPRPFYWATGAAFGAMLASKYLPQMIAVVISYYWLFQRIPETKWRLGKKRLLLMFVIMGVVFLLLNPTILLPDTWHQMGLFAGQKLVGHDGYEFMGRLYTHRMTDWLRGIPWYFYYAFLIVKLPLLTLAAFVIGLPLLFRRKLGDGRYFILLWFFIWIMTFTFAGGKFTRYLTVVLPAVLITSAIGIQATGRWLADLIEPVSSQPKWRVYAPAILGSLVFIFSAIGAAGFAPHFRLYTNAIGGGSAKAGYYFPHDEFYDASIKDALAEISTRAKPGAHFASETPSLAAYYAERDGRPDLVCVALSDPNALKQLSEGDFIINARGRRYFSNDAIISALQNSSTPVVRLNLNQVPSGEIYMLDQKSLNVVTETAKHLPPLAQNINLSRGLKPTIN